MRFFNTAGPVRSDIHYCLPPLERLKLPDVLTLIEQQKYFVLHAPRQVGKTTCLLALMDYLNREGRYRCSYCNVENAQSARENVQAGMRAILSEMAGWARDFLKDNFLEEHWQEVLAQAGEHSALSNLLTLWAEHSGQPLVLLIDEIDSLVGDTLIAVLRQLRSGYPKRPRLFPQTIILCGVRDVRDYRIHSDEGKAIITGGSAFNIKAESLRLGDFGQTEVETLYRQHTEETGQPFDSAALARVWELTRGQPWLVNALAYETCFRLEAGRDRSRPITADLINEAKERLILRRETHLHQLTDKLRESRVRSVIEPMLAGRPLGNVPEDDRDYVVDLGLARRSAGGGLIIANPIYREVIPRALASGPQDSLPQIQPTWLRPDGRLDPDKLLQAFLAFWRQHGQPLLGSAPYHEIAPHLVLMAFLHRVANAGGSLEREYAIGSGRMDICLRYGPDTLAMELKVWRDGEPDPLQEGLAQLDDYLSGLGLPTGWLVIFDRRSGLPPISQRTSTETASTPNVREVTVIRG
jgi:hypothetical protein